MDGDLQDRPEVIPELYKKAKEGFDVVFVSRKNRNEKLYYRLGQKIFYWALRNLSGIRFDSQQANFSIINKKVVEAFRNFPENARFYGTTIKWLGFKSSFIVADQGVRHSGKPSYTIKKRISLASDVILSFSNRPLKIAIGIGVLMSVISISLVFLIIYGKLMWNFSVIGWPSIMASIFFTGGNILIVLGIVGIYIGKIFEEVKSRPLYVIAERCNL
jgi:dolichol-phosphate mannosyltransferase